METSQQLSQVIRTPVRTAGALVESDPLLVDHTSRRLAHRPEAVRRARRIAESALTAWGIHDDAAHSVLLVVSELVTNAVEHGQPPLALHLGRECTGPRVWVGVTDGGPSAGGGPWTSSCAHDEHGRGLAIVEALAAAHGTHRHLGGTTHWARLP
ncbi:ATP-binding protein [Streptomyces sp. NPDC052040]|uniref:ATP-binding protein n=1 Tax=unclassified Streptomyces TaxID=2593676 RepID=UPI0037D34750